MLILEFLAALEHEVPLAAVGYSRDAVGLQAGLPKLTELRAALFAYEVTTAVIEEAVKRGANLIVAFHPLIFPSIDSVTDATRTGALIRDLIKQDIALYILHTAFDTHPVFGTSRLMAETLSLKNIRTLEPEARTDLFANMQENTGMGAIGELQKPLPSAEFLSLVATAFGTPVLRANRNAPERIETVALLGGAGMEYYSQAIAQKADAFITADVRYHDFYRADHDSILLIDAGHAETERFVTHGMVRAAQKALSEMALSQFAVSLSAQTNLRSQKSVESVEDLLLIARTEPNAVRYFAQAQNLPN